jgi:hypothetical protein
MSRYEKTSDPQYQPPPPLIGPLGGQGPALGVHAPHNVRVGGRQDGALLHQPAGAAPVLPLHDTRYPHSVGTLLVSR